MDVQVLAGEVIKSTRIVLTTNQFMLNLPMPTRINLHFRQLSLLHEICNLLKNGQLPVFQMFFMSCYAAFRRQEVDFLDGPKQGRSLRPRSRTKSSTAPSAPEPEATSSPGEAPKRGARGAKYDGLWAMLQHPDSEKSSESAAWRWWEGCREVLGMEVARGHMG